MKQFKVVRKAREKEAPKRVKRCSVQYRNGWFRVINFAYHENKMHTEAKHWHKQSIKH